MTLFPTGTITLVFTDIESSSALGEQYRDAFETAREAHNRLLRDIAAQWQGVEIKTIGDAFFLAFAKASDAVQFAVAAQRDLAAYPWASLLPGLDALRVRIGMHTGEPQARQQPNGAYDYFGPSVNRAARVAAAGHGGQIVVSNATYELALPGLPAVIAFEDRGVHRLRGVGEERLWQVLHQDLAADFLPLRTLNPECHNLPLPPTPYLGRSEEIKALSELLRRPGTRLVTLHGFGGIGKTRTALQIAELCIDAFADGAWWIPLHNVTTGDAMMQRIAEQLRLHLQPQPTVREQVWNFYRDRHVLLVLDNTEQVEANGAAEVVSGLLQAGPRVTILVTSRRSLDLAAEHLVELAPLPSGDAAALFVERAQARKASFALTAENTADVGAICRSLDGLPLAIEIAASLIVLLTPRQILKRLDDRLTLLVAHDPGLPRRQQALRAAIDWSYDLLSGDAKAVFSQLAVFAGGFSLEAAEAVCVGADVIRSVLELRGNSLLRAETDAATQQERLSMLGSVRDYAAAILTDDTVRPRHATYYLGYAEERTAQLRTRSEATALAELEAEFDNLRAAFTWARAQQQNALCARLGLALYQALYWLGFWSEAQQCLQAGSRALDAVRDDAPERLMALRATLEYHLASLASDMGDATGAQQHAEVSLTLSCALNDTAGTANALNLLGLLAEPDDAVAAAGFYTEALQLCPADQPVIRGKTLHNLAHVAERQGNLAEAGRLYEVCLAERRLAGDIRGEAATLGNLGALAQDAGDLGRALRFYQAGLQLRRTLREPAGTAIMLHNLGDLARIEGDHARAVTLFVHAQRIFHQLQSPLASESARELQQVHQELGDAIYYDLMQVAAQSAWESVV